MFVDASAICSILLQESDAALLSRRLETGEPKRTSALAVWESVVAIGKKADLPPAEALSVVQRFLADTDIDIVAVPPEAAGLAVEAFERFGKGRHPAGLNFGDCFSYACARHLRAPLLYKGGDFSLTDIASALPAD
jgi:ribonuclease VapC